MERIEQSIGHHGNQLIAVAADKGPRIARRPFTAVPDIAVVAAVAHEANVSFENTTVKAARRRILLHRLIRSAIRPARSALAPARAAKLTLTVIAARTYTLTYA
jgi:hypothetical protein